MVCDVGGVSGVRVVFEPGHFDLRAVLEDRGTRIPGALYGWTPAGRFRVARGLGDIAIGATAPLAALKLTNFSRRRGFIFWQILGIFDLVTAVTVGTTARWISPNEVGTGLMTVLPLSLIPTFAVPLLMMLHVICIAQARQWRAGEYAHVGEQLRAAAS